MILTPNCRLMSTTFHTFKHFFRDYILRIPFEFPLNLNDIEKVNIWFRWPFNGPWWAHTEDVIYFLWIEPKKRENMENALSWMNDAILVEFQFFSNEVLKTCTPGKVRRTKYRYEKPNRCTKSQEERRKAKMSQEEPRRAKKSQGEPRRAKESQWERTTLSEVKTKKN